MGASLILKFADLNQISWIDTLYTPFTVRWKNQIISKTDWVMNFDPKILNFNTN